MLPCFFSNLMQRGYTMCTCTKMGEKKILLIFSALNMPRLCVNPNVKFTAIVNSLFGLLREKELLSGARELRFHDDQVAQTQLHLSHRQKALIKF